MLSQLDGRDGGPAHARTGLVKYASTLDVECARAISGAASAPAPGGPVKKQNL
jgi:hypothetical protein